MFTKWVYSRFWIVLLLLPAVVVYGQPPTQLYKTIEKEKLPSKINCMLLSASGFFYLGATEGLYLYDGSSSKHLSVNNPVVKNCSALFEDSNGMLWIGSSNGTICKYSNRQFEEWKPEEGLPKAAISKIVQDKNKRIWFATRGEGVYVIHNNRLYNINADDGLADNYIYDLQFINGKIVASTDNGISICWYDGTNKTISNFNTKNGLSDNIVQCITADNKESNIVWLGYQNGSVGKFNLITQDVIEVYQSKKENAQVNNILPLDKEIWVATDAGLLKINRKNNQLIPVNPFNKLNALYKDNEANVWLLGSENLFISKGEQLQLLLQTSANENRYIHDLLIDKEGNYWITSQSGIIKYKNQTGDFTKQFIPLKSLDTKTDITCLYQDQFENIWVGTMGKGVFVINPHTLQSRNITDVPEFINASVLSITGHQNHIWIAGLQGILLATVSTNQQTKKSEYQFQNLKDSSGIGTTYIYHILEDSKERVWFATDGRGLAMLEKGIYKTFREKEGLKAKVIYTIMEDDNKNIWFSTPNYGLICYNGKTFKTFGIENGLPDLNISSLAKDNHGSIVGVTQKGIFLLNPVTETINLIVNAEEIGELNSDLNSIFSNHDQILFHSATGLYSYYRPAYKKTNSSQTKITGLSLYLNEIDTLTHKELKHDENNLSFSFTGIYYTNPDLVQYQYKLDGYNNEWQFSKNNVVNFPKLQPADYTFRVRSSTTNTFTNTNEASFAFSIKKPFWKQWWFVILSVAFVTGILIYIIKEREQSAQNWQQLQTEKLQSQYETLKNQVNPHFLFNSFNTLLSIIEEDPQKAAQYVEHLSDFYRSIVNIREKDLISLSEELRIIEDYFFIQKKRFGEALNFEISLTDNQKETYSMPPLTLQLLAENAIKHNIVSKEIPLLFQLYIENDHLIVQNNLNIKASKEKGEGLGLQNIKNRFLLIAQKEVVIETTQTHFIVKLPLIKKS